MSAITYTFDLASSQSAAQSAPASGAGNTAALEQSYLSASAPREVAASAPVGQEAGPGLTTLAVGEEDGGGMSTPPHTGDMSTPTPDGDYQVTTLAIGEEDGGGASSHAMSPIGDDNAVIGGHSVSSMGAGELPEGYGQMQPVYSPGEAEYPAFAKTSQTTDILNFHPVPRSFTATVQQSIQPTQMAPIGTDTVQKAMPAPADTVSQPVYSTYTPGDSGMAPIGNDTMQTAISAPAEAAPQPVYSTYTPAHSGMAPIGNDTMQTMTPAPVETAPQTTYAVADPAPAPAEATYATVDTGYTAEPLSVEAPAGNYESVGSYEEYVAGTSGTMTMAPAETAPSEPVYEQYQPAADMSAYDSTSPVAAAPVEAPAPTETPAPVEYAAPVNDAAPEVSAEPAVKPPLFEKDAPLDYSGAEQTIDPADGKPDYVAPAEAVPAEGAKASEPKSEATYVNVPLDAYLVEPAGASTPEAVPTNDAAPEAAPASDKAPQAVAPEAAPAPASSQGISMGGSFTVMDQALPSSVSGEASGIKATTPETAAPDVAEATDTTPASTAQDELSITTLAIGEEDGGGS